MITYENATNAQRAAVENRIGETVRLQSALVDELIKREFDGFTVDDMENLYQPRCPECGEEIEELDDADDDGNTHKCTYCDWTGEESDCESEPQEVYEWWLIDRHTCHELRDIGEVVIDNDYGEWWGRTCTGQSIALDPTFWVLWQEWIKGSED